MITLAWSSPHLFIDLGMICHIFEKYPHCSLQVCLDQAHHCLERLKDGRSTMKGEQITCNYMDIFQPFESPGSTSVFGALGWGGGNGSE